MALRQTQPNDSVALILDGAFFELLEQQNDLPFEIKIDGSRVMIVAQNMAEKDKSAVIFG